MKLDDHRERRIGFAFPLISPDKWIAASDQAGFKPEPREPILEGNAARLLFGGQKAA